ncbi:MAG: bifunctional riboflavin kinase/FAD synthetase [Proteobacteria bacterium]|nr:bifunctional riboflavin kinase/FAD synthetase [Pseudomonadota bacterium]MDA1355532.1 bifunctional riboflavin kinase/FAD synthetase [Pseudomonadota bacterium]
MRIYRHWREVPAEGRGAVVAIGNFDGVHLGHQAVISDARRIAQEAGAPLAILTFEPHPREVLGQTDGPFRLTPFRIKLREIAKLGVDILYLLKFDQNMAALTAADFIDRLLVDGLGVSHVIVGYDFAFGRQRGGNFALLQEHAVSGGYRVTQVSVAGTDEGKYSASEARARLRAGDVVGAAQILGRPWEIEGRVQHGEHRGRKLGFATANLAVAGTLHPAHGVYALWVGIDRGAGDGLVWWPAVANLGRRPTFDENELLLEVHVLDFDGDLYGQRLRAQFVARVRPERRFDGLDALIAQIARDTACARDLLSADNGPDGVTPAVNPATESAVQ